MWLSMNKEIKTQQKLLSNPKNGDAENQAKQILWRILLKKKL